MSHQTKKIRITIEVDKKIAVVVSWINSFFGTYTEYSCEGNDNSPGMDRPYVIFYCNTREALRTICRYTYSYGDIIIDLDHEFSNFRYTLRFKSKENLNSFTKNIKGSGYPYSLRMGIITGIRNGIKGNW